MKVRTERLGVVEVAEEEILDLRDGLFGFPEVERYVLLETNDRSPFRWLQAVGRPDVAFVVIDPRLFVPGYAVELTGDERRSLGAEEGVELDILVVVGIPEDPRNVTANLKGPIVLHRNARRGVQVIHPEDYSTRFRILDALRNREGKE